jgi:hypothetical protein
MHLSVGTKSRSQTSCSASAAERMKLVSLADDRLRRTRMAFESNETYGMDVAPCAAACRRVGAVIADPRAVKGACRQRFRRLIDEERT